MLIVEDGYALTALGYARTQIGMACEAVNI